MAARAIWKGVVTFADEKVPVKLYSAIEDRTVHFRLLHEKDLVPVKQRMVNPDTNEEVPSEKIRRGYAVDRDTFVVLDDEELTELEPTASRTIEVTRFVAAGGVPHPWFDRPYWLGPDGDDEAYFALGAALRRRDRQAEARWTMRKKHYAGVVRAEGDHLVLITLRHADEVVRTSELDAPAGRDLSAQEVRMAGQLLEALEGEFVPTDYRDEYRARVMDLIRTKAEGGTVEVEPYAPRREPESLSRALKGSLARAREERRSA